MRLERAQSIADLRRMAKRRLPKILFEFIEYTLTAEGSIQDNLRRALPEVADQGSPRRHRA